MIYHIHIICPHIWTILGAWYTNRGFLWHSPACVFLTLSPRPRSASVVASSSVLNDATCEITMSGQPISSETSPTTTALFRRVTFLRIRKKETTTPPPRARPSASASARNAPMNSAGAIARTEESRSCDDSQQIRNCV